MSSSKSFLFFIFLIYGFSRVDSYNRTFYNELRNVISNTASIKNIADDIVKNHRQAVNQECLDDLTDFLRSFGQQWTLRMVDSAGKLPHGILKLNLNHLGQHGECIEISNKKPSGRMMRGQHCLLTTTIFIPKEEQQELIGRSITNLNNDLVNVRLLPENLMNRDGFTRNQNIEVDDRSTITSMIAVCLPSSCKASEINAILRPSDISSVNVVFQIMESSCTTEKTVVLTPGDIGTISFLSVVGFIMLCSTAYDLWYQIIKKGDKADQSPLYTAFSVYTNSQRLFTPSKNPGPLACLHGIRSLSLMWVVFGHRYSIAIGIPSENLADVLDWSQTVGSSLLLGAAVSVDSFFLMSGLLVSYTFFRSAKLKNIAKELPIFYIHRIIRLTPLLAVVILLYCTILTHYGNGPFTKSVDIGVYQTCREYWWTTLLYINNYVHEPSCIGQTWYLSVDMQLYILSPLIIYPLLWNKKIGLIWISFWIAAAQATVFALTYVRGYPAGILSRGPEFEDYHKKFYIPMHTRAVPYLIGLLAGYFLYHSFRKIKITTIQYNFLKQTIVKKLLLIIGWLVSLAILAAVVFGTHPLDQATHKFSHWEDTMFNTFSKTAWAVGLLWIIVACGYGFGGPINWFLSLRVWEILGRFSYAIYLTHMIPMVMIAAHENHVKLFTHTHVFLDFVGDMVLSFAVSYLLILGFESPIAVLEKLLFKKHKAEKSAPSLPMQAENVVQKKTNEINS